MAVRIEENFKNVATMTKKTGGVSNRLTKETSNTVSCPELRFQFCGIL